MGCYRSTVSSTTHIMAKEMTTRTLVRESPKMDCEPEPIIAAIVLNREG